MTTCRQCGASLAATELVEPRCPRCGAAVDPKATHLEGAGMATVDLPGDVVVDPRATHLEGAGMATVDLPGGVGGEGADFEIGGKSPTVADPMIDATYAFDAGKAAELARELEGPKTKTVVER